MASNAVIADRDRIERALADERAKGDERFAATVRGLEAERDGLRKELDAARFDLNYALLARDSSRATTEAVMAERDAAREELAQANMRLVSWPANTLALDEIKRIATAAIPVNVAPDTDNALGAVQHLIAFNEKGIRQCGEALEPHVGSDFPTVLDGIAELIKLHQVNASTVATANRALDDLGVPQCEGLLARIHWLWDWAGSADLRRMLDYLVHEHEVASATNHQWRSGRLDALYRAARHCEALIHGDTIVVEEPVAESGLAIEEPRKPQEPV